MKRVLCLLGAVLLSLCSCQGQVPLPTTEPATQEEGALPKESAPTPSQGEESPQDLAPLKRKLLGDWSGYLVIKEASYRDMLWCLDYVEEFTSSPNAQALEMAKTALAACEMQLSQYQELIPERKLSPQEITQLTKGGVEASFLSTYSAENDLEVLLTRDCISLRGGLYQDAYFQTSLSIFKEYCATLRSYYQTQLQYICTLSKRLLLSLEDPALSEEFQAYLEEALPSLLAYEGSLPDDPALLLSLSEEKLSHLEDLNQSFSQIVGRQQADLDRLKDLLAAGDLASLSAETIPYPSLPLLPSFPWDDLQKGEYSYFYLEEDQIHVPTAQTELSSPPNGVNILYPAISDQELQDYLDLLKRYCPEAMLHSTTEKEGTTTLIFTMGDGIFTLIQKEDSFTFYTNTNTVLFCPLLYLSIVK